jgi:hypothetical protein
MFGALVVDRVGPKRLLVTMLCVQGVFGFFMYVGVNKPYSTSALANSSFLRRSGFYVQLSKNGELTWRTAMSVYSPASPSQSPVSRSWSAPLQSSHDEHVYDLYSPQYGLFLSFGEAGPGDCLGLLASKRYVEPLSFSLLASPFRMTSSAHL